MMVGFADETVVGAESVGARLRSAREAHGLSLDDIAARTRVPTRHLKAIEDDAFDQLPAAPYSVGFAKAFADAVGLNREEIGREFRAEKEGYGGSDVGPSYISDEPSPSGSSGLLRIALILVIIAVIALGLWKSGLFGGSSQVATPAVAPPPAPAAAPPTMAPAAPEAEAPSPSTDEAGNRTREDNQAREESSRTGQGNEQTEETSRSNRRNGESRDEPRSGRTSDTGADSGATEAPAPGPAPKTTRDLNMEAIRPSAPATGTAPPTAVPPPPVVAPPTPAATPPAATP